jgi:hypothetical protein
MPNLTMNVGFQGESGSKADIAEPSLLTRTGHREGLLLQLQKGKLPLPLEVVLHLRCICVAAG